MRSIDPEYLQHRADELGLDRGKILATIQTSLDRRFPGKVRAKSLNNGVLRIVTPSASLASELRLMQVMLIAEFHDLGAEFERLSITIAPL